MGEMVSDASPQRIPAWKRLGLSLKHAKEIAPEYKEPSKITTSSEKRTPSSDQENSPGNSVLGQHAHKKRRIHESGPDKSSPESDLNRNGSNKKRVSFTAETKKEDGDTAISIIPSELGSVSKVHEHTSPSTDRPTKKTKISKKVKAQKNLEKKVHTALQYLEAHQKSPENWKFNKNKETWLFKHLFSVDDIPTEYDKALSSYLLGLKGESAKERLVQRANDELAQVGLEIVSALDQEPEKTGDEKTMDDPIARARYREDAARRYKRNFEAYIDALAESKEQQGPEQQKRLAKRRRAEIVLWAVDVDHAVGKKDGKRLDLTTPSMGSKATSSSSASIPVTNGVKRKRKNRVATIEITDSSSSESDSESESDSDETSSDGDSDAETGETVEGSVSSDDPNLDTTSASSSVSSSDDESETTSTTDSEDVTETSSSDGSDDNSDSDAS